MMMTDGDKIAAAIYAAVKCQNLQKLNPADFLIHFNGMMETMRYQEEHPEPVAVILKKFATGADA
jgi:hypothetical protein